jgi:hypothetical protein
MAIPLTLTPVTLAILELLTITMKLQLKEAELSPETYKARRLRYERRIAFLESLLPEWLKLPPINDDPPAEPAKE